MTAKARICLVALDHRHDDYLDDLFSGARAFCPDADLVLYDSSGSGRASPVAKRHDVPVLPISRHLEYAKVTTFFFDVFEWAADRSYDYLVNLETDMAFVRSGFEDFLGRVMAGVDHLAPRFGRRTPKTSRWRPYRTLKPELPELFEILGIDYTNECFSPAQVFSRRYVDTLLASPFYPRLRQFVADNRQTGRSFTLQEVLLPTLPDVLGLTVRDYPADAVAMNRYRPYHARAAIERARKRPGVHLVHPVRRDAAHPARQLVRELVDSGGTQWAKQSA
jgi:hypothetical protein